MIVRFMLMLVLVQPIMGLMCYFCSDTSSAKGRSQCQTYIRTMRYYGKRAIDTGKYKTEKYVKNCTDYGTNGNPVYCMIASLELNNNVKSYIRDCSDGTSIFGGDIDSLFSDVILLPDNQTSCRYTGQGYVACVTLCGSDYDFKYNDFCNGPTIISSATTLHVPLLLLLTVLKLTHSVI